MDVSLLNSKPLLVYADTSVYGGVFDDEFAKPSQRFFERVREGRFRLMLSGLVLAELRQAPPQVSALLDEMVGIAEV